MSSAKIFIVYKLNLVLINRPAHNSGLAKAAIEICAKIEHPLGSLRQAAKRYNQNLKNFFAYALGVSFSFLSRSENSFETSWYSKYSLC